MTTLATARKVSTSPPEPPRRRRALRFAAGIIGIVSLAAAVGATWQHVASERAGAATPPPGEMVDVGGRDLHLQVSGDRTGPTIVLEAAMFGFSAQWAWVQEELAAHHTVVAYDRPGLGWSDPDPRGADPDRIAGDLHTALRRQGLQEPWILVGHSTGGLLVRTFAERYPDEVAGIVLVDATHPDMVQGPMYRIAGPVVRLLGRTGVLRATGLLAREAAGLPPDAMPMLTSTGHIDGAAREMAALATFGRDATAAGRLGSTPLTVVTAGKQSQGWHDLQRELAALSSPSRHVVVPGAGHKSLVTDRQHARIVADEIAQRARSSSRR
jgi:pimeloyl-ACP methyl ester carboxylesterase